MFPIGNGTCDLLRNVRVERGIGVVDPKILRRQSLIFQVGADFFPLAERPLRRSPVQSIVFMSFDVKVFGL
jgi:hypothetical protein